MIIYQRRWHVVPVNLIQLISNFNMVFNFELNTEYLSSSEPHHSPWTIYTCDWCQRWLLLFWHFVAPLFHLYTHYFYFGGVYCWDCCWWELCQTTKSTSLYNVYTFSEVFVNGKDLSNNKSHLFLQYIHIFRGAYCWVTICEDPKIITATSVDNLIYT